LLAADELRHDLGLVAEQDGALRGDRLDQRPPGEQIIGHFCLDDHRAQHLKALEGGGCRFGTPDLVLTPGRRMLWPFGELDLPERAQVIEPGERARRVNDATTAAGRRASPSSAVSAPLRRR
jgi:hypothetical protein